MAINLPIMRAYKIELSNLNKTLIGFVAVTELGNIVFDNKGEAEFFIPGAEPTSISLLEASKLNPVSDINDFKIFLPSAQKVQRARKSGRQRGVR